MLTQVDPRRGVLVLSYHVTRYGADSAVTDIMLDEEARDATFDCWWDVHRLDRRRVDC
jgi:hypothetical protein